MSFQSMENMSFRSDTDDDESDLIDVDNAEINEEHIENEEKKEIEPFDTPFWNISMDVLIYKILGEHYELNVNEFPEETTEFCFFGYFRKDLSRRVYFLFPNIILDQNWPSFGTFFDFYDSPILKISDIKKLSLIYFPYSHEFFGIQQKWFNLQELEISFDKDENDPSGWFCKYHFPSLEKVTIQSNRIFPSYEKHFFSKNFKKLKSVEILHYDELLPHIEGMKQLTEISVLCSKGFFCLTRYLKDRLKILVLQNHHHRNESVIGWKSSDIFSKLEYLEVDIISVSFVKRICFYEHCFPILKELKVSNYDFNISYPVLEANDEKVYTKCSFPSSLKVLTVENCFGEIIKKQIPNIEKLVVKKMESRGTGLIFCKSLFQNIDFSKIIHLEIKDIPNFTSSDTHYFWGSLTQLRILDISEYIFGEHELRNNLFPEVLYLRIINCGQNFLGKFGRFPKLKGLVFKMNENLFNRHIMIRNYSSFLDEKSFRCNLVNIESEYIHYVSTGCFENSMKVKVKVIRRRRKNSRPEISIIRMDEVRVNDYVESYDEKSKRITYSKVFSVILHERRKRIFINFNNGVLKVTPNHLIFMCPHRKKSSGLILRKAGNVKIGDWLGLTDINNNIEFLEVKSLNLEIGKVSNVYTRNGNIIVNGVLCSVFTSQTDNKYFKERKLSNQILGNKVTKYIRRALKPFLL